VPLGKDRAMTTTHGYVDQRDQLLKRVNRLEGQVRGVGRMIVEDRYCIDIVNQLSAVQAAARELSLQLLESHVRHCVVDAVREDNAEPKVQELIDTLAKAMGR
jgi:CsoR family transcriptional regulator, copper-sensing transcriptional repressor